VPRPATAIFNGGFTTPATSIRYARKASERVRAAPHTARPIPRFIVRIPNFR
jgi:hypothetical protein